MSGLPSGIGGQVNALPPKAIIMSAKYAGKCATCGLPFIVGEQIAWVPGVKHGSSYHPLCYNGPVQAGRSSPKKEPPVAQIEVPQSTTMTEHDRKNTLAMLYYELQLDNKIHHLDKNARARIQLEYDQLAYDDEELPSPWPDQSIDRVVGDDGLDPETGLPK